MFGFTEKSKFKLRSCIVSFVCLKRVWTNFWSCVQRVTLGHKCIFRITNKGPSLLCDLSSQKTMCLSHTVENKLYTTGVWNHHVPRLGVVVGWLGSQRAKRKKNKKKAKGLNSDNMRHKDSRVNQQTKVTLFSSLQDSTKWSDLKLNVLLTYLTT